MPQKEWRKALAQAPKRARALAELDAPGRREQVRVARARKILLGCIDCGYDRHPEALHFDHRPGVEKLFNVSTWRGDIEAMYLEMDKCDVVCANCHAVRTSIRRENPERVSGRGYQPERWDKDLLDLDLSSRGAAVREEFKDRFPAKLRK